MRTKFDFHYTVTLLQDLYNRPFPSCFSTCDVGTSRRLVVDWEAVIAELWPTSTTLPNEGGLLAIQLMLLDDVRWDSHAPLLRQRFQAYRSWVFPLPPSLRAAHLDPDLLPGENAASLQRFHALRRQLFRLLGGRSIEMALALRASFELLMAPILASARPKGLSELLTHIDTVKLADAVGLNEEQLAAPHHIMPVCDVFRTTLGEELAALLRGERFGAVKDKNYLFVRHAGYAAHIESVGDTTPFHTSAVLLNTALLADNIRRTLRAKFRNVSAVTADRLFHKIEALRGLVYDPADWSIVSRVDVNASLRESGNSARRRHERSAVPRTIRQHRVVRLETPPYLKDTADAVSILWRKNTAFIDTKDLKDASGTGLAWDEILAFDTRGKVTHDPALYASVYYSRSALNHLGMSVLARWISAQTPSREVWLRLLKAKPKSARSLATFSRAQDRVLLPLWKPYQRKAVWEEFGQEYGVPAVEVRRRAEFVAFAVRHRALLIEELNDLATVERRLGPKAWKKWKLVARKACA